MVDPFMAVTTGLFLSMVYLMTCVYCAQLFGLLSTEVTTLASPLPVTCFMSLHGPHVHWVLGLKRLEATDLSEPGYKIILILPRVTSASFPQAVTQLSLQSWVLYFDSY